MTIRILVFTCVLALACLTTVQAQDISTTSFAFRGGSLARSKSFLILETGVLGRVVGSKTHRNLDPAMLVADIGYMRNTSDRWAFGGSGHMTLSDEGAKFGVRGRARYWFTPRIGLDLMPGVFVYSAIDLEEANGPGLNLGASLTLGDLLSIDAYLESIPVRGWDYYWDGMQVNSYRYKEQRTALYLGATGRSYFAPVVAGGVLILAALVAASWS